MQASIDRTEPHPPRTPKVDLSTLPALRGLPILGSTLAFLRDPYGLYREGLARHGPVFRIDVLGSRYVVLAGPEALEHVYLDRSNLFSARLGLLTFAPYFAGGLLHRDGDDHRVHRRVMQPAFRAEAMRGYLDAMNHRAAAAVASWPDGQRIAMAPEMKQLTLDMAARVLMGLSDDAAVMRMNRLFQRQVAGTTAPIRRPLPFTAMRRGLDARDTLMEGFRSMIAERRAAGGNDFFSQLCLAGNDGSWSDVEIVDHFNFLLVAAHDAATAALTTMLWALARDRGLQARLQAEVDALPPGPLRYEDAGSLDLIDRTFREALRMMAPSAFTARRIMRDTEWMGRRLPAGADVVLCPGPVMMDPAIWTAPEQFDPDRFGPERAEDRAHPFAWSPFGGGAHKCIGLHFAGLQVKAVMVPLLRVRTVTMAPRDEPVWRQVPTPRPVNGLPLTLARR